MTKKKRPDQLPQPTHRELLKQLELLHDLMRACFHDRPIPASVLSCLLHSEAHLLQAMSKVAYWIEQEERAANTPASQ